MARLRKGESYYEIEQLTNVNRLNEHLLTGLRTEWGVRRSVLEDIAKGSWDKMIGRIRTGDRDLFHMEEDTLTLTHQGKLMADRLSSELFF